jgi:hypothetical protein
LEQLETLEYDKSDSVRGYDKNGCDFNGYDYNGFEDGYDFRGYDQNGKIIMVKSQTNQHY